MNRFATVLTVVLLAASPAWAQVERLDISIDRSWFTPDGTTLVDVVVTAFDGWGSVVSGAPVKLSASGGAFEGEAADQGDGTYVGKLRVPGADFASSELVIRAALVDGSKAVQTHLVTVREGEAPPEDGPAPAATPVEEATPQSAGTKTRQRQLQRERGARSAASFNSWEAQVRAGFIVGAYKYFGGPCEPGFSGCETITGLPSQYHFVLVNIDAPDAPGVSVTGEYFPLAFVGPYARWEMFAYRTNYEVDSGEGQTRRFGDVIQHLTLGGQGRYSLLNDRLALLGRVGVHTSNTMLFRRVVNDGLFVATFERRWLWDLDIGVGAVFQILEALSVRADYDLEIALRFRGVVGHRLDAGFQYQFDFLEGPASGIFMGVDFNLWMRGFRLSYTFENPPPVVLQAEQRGAAVERNLGARIAVGYRL
jgi:hypothetical protein